MILVFGGAYMGKLSLVKKEYGIADADICDLAEGYEPGKKCYRHLESLTRRLAVDGSGVMAVLPDFPADAIIISREIGSGVVPVDTADRRWRDVHGSLLQKLSAECSSVYRVYFGIAEKLK